MCYSIVGTRDVRNLMYVCNTYIIVHIHTLTNLMYTCDTYTCTVYSCIMDNSVVTYRFREVDETCRTVYFYIRNGYGTCVDIYIVYAFSVSF